MFISRGVLLVIFVLLEKVFWMLRLSCLSVADTTSRRPAMSSSVVRCLRRCQTMVPCCPLTRARSWARWRGWNELLAIWWITLFSPPWMYHSVFLHTDSMCLSKLKDGLWTRHGRMKGGAEKEAKYAAQHEVKIKSDGVWLD